MNWLQLDKPPQKTRVVVAMSGGVDSSVTAALLAEAGYEVIGLTLQLYDYGEALAGSTSKTCCAGIDIYDARQVAEKIGIPHYVLDYESRFKQSVMEDFADSYLAGETPIPCVRCNQTVKFTDMFKAARDLGADALATGHYVRWKRGSQGPELHRGADPVRDQSYFLFTTTPEQLALLRFPLGDLSKAETRAHAHRLGLEVAEKPDSQDICFVPDGNYARVVERLRPGALEKGDIVHINGTKLGEHNGIINFTIGQRKGLKIPSPDGRPLFVVSLDPQEHKVIVGPREALSRSFLYLREVNWLGPTSGLEQDQRVSIKFRSSQDLLPATVRLKEGQKALVSLDAPEYGISKGQACVLYKGDRVLGGGWIEGTA